MKMELDSLLKEAYEYNDESPRKTELLQKAYTLAQTIQDVEQQLNIGKDLVQASQWSGNSPVALSIFPQLLTLADKNPQLEGNYSMLWEYKWVITDLPDFPTITKKQIFAALKDMENRYKKAGYGRKVIDHYYSIIYLQLGMIDQAKEFALLAIKSKGDSYMQDCIACVKLANFKLSCHTESLDNALKIGQPLFDKKYSCSSVPVGAYAYILPFLLNAGKMKYAKKIFEQYYEVMDQDSDFYHEPILYCIKSKQFTKALELLGKDTSKFLESSSSFYSPLKDIDCFQYALSFWYLCDQIVRAGKTKIKFIFHEDFILYNSTNSYVIKELLDFFKTETLALAKSFDQRNENNFISNQIIETFNY